jgi:hypothetical protein
VIDYGAGKSVERVFMSKEVWMPGIIGYNFSIKTHADLWYVYAEKEKLFYGPFRGLATAQRLSNELNMGREAKFNSWTQWPQA